MTRALTASLVVFCLIGPVSATAADDAHAGHSNNAQADAAQLLGQAAKAVQSVTYSGTIVYVHGGNFDTLKVVHRLKHGEEEERLVSQSGEAREVIRKGSTVTSILPDHKIVLVSESPPKTLLGSIANFSPAQLKKYYKVSENGETRFAGRECRVIVIVPDDRFRYGYRMLVDAKNDLPLKLTLRYKGKTLEQLMFTDVAFPAHVPDDDFLPSYDVRGFKIIRHQSVHVDSSSASKNADPWKAKDLPPGFRLAEDGVRQVTPKASVRQLLFTDGVATVSVFIAPAGLRPPFTGATRMGAVHAFGRIAGHSQVTVVGEVPAITAKRIADNLVRAK